MIGYSGTPTFLPQSISASISDSAGCFCAGGFRFFIPDQGSITWDELLHVCMMYALMNVALVAVYIV